MRKRKIYVLTLPCIIGVAIATFVMVALRFEHPKSVCLINSPTEIDCTGFRHGNYRQGTASVWLGTYNGKLYYYGGGKDGIDKTKFDDSLCVFEEGTLVELIPLSSRGNKTVTVIGIVNHYFYYLRSTNSNYKEQKLYCLDLETNKVSLLYSGHLFINNSMYFTDDGSVYIPLFPEEGKTSQYVHIFGGDVLGIEELADGYPLGDSIYFLVREYSDAQVERLIQTDSSGNIIQEEIPFEPAYGRTVIPYDDGVLVHNEQLGSLLYQINENGEVIELFSLPCLSSQSAVNIHGTDAYISVLRYEKYGEKGMLRYENDSLEGTYRISLIDGSSVKINNLCFDGIYNFDDTCFYCCDKAGNIYRMEFDGSTSPILLISGND